MSVIASQSSNKASRRCLNRSRPSNQGPPPTPAPTPAPVLPLREPRLPPPPPYAGEPGTCRSFLSQCTIAMELQALSLSYASALTQRNGPAVAWTQS